MPTYLRVIKKNMLFWELNMMMRLNKNKKYITQPLLFMSVFKLDVV